MQQDSSVVQPEAPGIPAAVRGDRWRGLGGRIERARRRLDAPEGKGGTSTRGLPIWLIMAIFVLSGAAGLIYEVVWSRQLVLVFGNTTQAVSTILTGFFGGMAIGSAFGGRLADRVRRPLRLYGILELLLVVLVLLTPLTFLVLHEAYRGVFDALVAAPHLLALVRFGLSLLALGPATILMGATLPTLTRYLSRDSSGLSSAFGRLYAANTFGAIIGTIVAGFILIELLGLSGALRVGATCSAIAGLVALLLDRARGPAADPGLRPTTTAPVSEAPVALGHGPRTRLRLALAVAFVSGLTSLGYQVLWTRLLASGTGNSTYVFTLILAIFLIGLALGAAVFAIFRTRIHTINLLALGQIAIGMLVLEGMAIVISRGTPGLLELTPQVDALYHRFALPVILVVLPATFLMGLTFPAASALIADPEGHVGANTGLLLSANTLGAITGTFLVPFVVIPLVGSPVALGLIALVNVGTGIALALGGRIEEPFARAITAATGAVTTIVLILALTLGGTFVDPNVTWIRSQHGTIAMSLEDEIASVQAGTALGQPQLWVTGTSMTLKTVDVKLMPILPLILRPNSKTDLTIAFGMGSAYRAALIAGLTATAVELVPSVPRTFGVFYSDAPQVLSNPNGHVVIADGRNFVELTDQHYDIVVVDPPPPIYSAGVSVISTREFYAAAKARLNTDGVMMQWIPFGPTLDEFKSHVRTFHDVFPHVIVAFGLGGSGLFMLGSDRPIAFDPATVREVLSRPGIVQDLSSAFDSPRHDLDGWASMIPTLVWIQGDQVGKFAGKGPLVTDDQPLPEYFLLHRLFGTPSPLVTKPLLESMIPAP
jgi:spermidine synthase